MVHWWWFIHSLEVELATQQHLNPLCSCCFASALWGGAQARRLSEAFQEQFLACNQSLLKQRGINCSLSGSTGIVAFLQVSFLLSFACHTLDQTFKRRGNELPCPPLMGNSECDGESAGQGAAFGCWGG
jgi:hypothetical protein